MAKASPWSRGLPSTLPSRATTVLFRLGRMLSGFGVKLPRP